LIFDLAVQIFDLSSLISISSLSPRKDAQKLIVPFLDLKAQYQTIKEEIDAAIQEVVNSCAFAGGPFVAKFEEEFAAYCDCVHVAGVGSGTEALWLALAALGIGPGDEVITVPNTFIATAEAISFCGAHPVFVDVDPATFNMDPAQLDAFLAEGCDRDAATGLPVNRTTGRTVKAVIPVHLYGQMADMAPIMETAKAWGLKVIEDASQAHGAEYNGKRAGSIGDAGCFSFYPGKNLGAYGEAGAVVTNNAELAGKIKILRDHGQPKKYYHNLIGWNARMDGIQGAILSTKLKHIDTWNAARIQVAEKYHKHLSKVSALTCPTQSSSTKHVYHIYAVCVPDRESFMAALSEKKITTAIHYPVPIHLQEAYDYLKIPKGSYPVAEKSSQEVVSLPIYPELTPTQIDYVTQTIKQIL
jgi:dTDP-4-amino-4,6-dideoxygalactose transaminase